MKLYVFDPDSDLALADNGDNYIPPQSVRRLAEDLALLPVWYAQPGSAVLAASAYNADYLKLMKQLFPIQVDLVTLPELATDYSDVQVMPWGWSRTFRNRMLKAGICEHRLPTFDELEQYRTYASRRQELLFAQLIQSGQDYFRHYLIGDEMFEHLERMYADKVKIECVLKSLWSGSGRGLYWCWNGLTKAALNWGKRELVARDAFVVEPIYDRVENFAMEFYSNGQGRVLFTGYSSFETTSSGVYRSNVLSSDALIESWICCYVTLPDLIRIREQVQQALEKVYASVYVGPIGVDMMVCRKPDMASGYVIHPHVEVNLRMTMGQVARQFYDRFVAPGHEGRFYIETYESPRVLQECRAQNICQSPLVVKKGRLVSGCLELVPVTPKSCSRAYVVVY